MIPTETGACPCCIFFHFLSLRERHLQVQPGAGRCVAAHQRLGAAARRVNPASQPSGVPCHCYCRRPPSVPVAFGRALHDARGPPTIGTACPPTLPVPRRGGGCGHAASRVARGAVPRAACDGDGPQRAFFGGAGAGAEVRATCGDAPALRLLSLPATAARGGRRAGMRGFGYCLGVQRRVRPITSAQFWIVSKWKKKLPLVPLLDGRMCCVFYRLQSTIVIPCMQTMKTDVNACDHSHGKSEPISYLR